MNALLVNFERAKGKLSLSFVVSGLALILFYWIVGAAIVARSLMPHRMSAFDHLVQFLLPTTMAGLCIVFFAKVKTKFSPKIKNVVPLFQRLLVLYTGALLYSALRVCDQFYGGLNYYKWPFISLQDFINFCLPK